MLQVGPGRPPGALRRGLRRLYADVPALRPLMRHTRQVLVPPHFSGWGMRTDHADPWDDPTWANFGQAQQDMSGDVEHGLLVDTDVSPTILKDLRWRHWIVAFCVRYAASFELAAAGRTMGLVECGVGDGLSAYFACHEATYQASRRAGLSYTMHCYDAWGPMAEADLLPTEWLHRNGYRDSSLERTKRNLRRFSENVVFHPGHIPESLATGPSGPEQVAYLSVDLNAAKPTVAVLEHFLPRLSPRGIVLMDDYGHRPYIDTKRAVDQFFSDKPGMVLKLPTGQAAYLA